MASIDVNGREQQEVDGAGLDSLARWPAERLSREEFGRLVEDGEIEAVIVATADIQGSSRQEPARPTVLGGG